jgi:hypothetical protein
MKSANWMRIANGIFYIFSRMGMDCEETNL